MRQGFERFGLSSRHALAGVALALVLAVALPAAAGAFGSNSQRSVVNQLRALADRHATKSFWQGVPRGRLATRHGRKPVVRARHLRTLTLDTRRLRSALAGAPRERTHAARVSPAVVSLPAPDGSFQRFALQQSAIMAPGLARKHPEIKTYSGRGIDDPGATIHADLSPLGFHASVRSDRGAWYIDPYYNRDATVYASYYGRDALDVHGTFVERDAEGAELSIDHGYYHAADDVTVNGSGFAENVAIDVTISDPEQNFASRTVHATADGQGSFTATFEADPDGNVGDHVVGVSDGKASAQTSYQVVTDEDTTKDPPTGDQLRTYRLALITDPGYAAFFGGSANVTAAKVALMNRVDQVYEDDLTIRMQLIADNDKLNLDTWAAATAPNGPCGAAACFTQAQVTGCSTLSRNRTVIGQIIGADNYDIGHLALGEPGGGVANLGVVGRSAKAQGCTGIPTPVGDFYAIDYVAHEMGHQFSGNHPFNGNQLNCSGGNRNAATSVEPGSGTSIMAYAGICLTDDLQPHSDPYFSQRSQQEITTYVSGAQLPLNEVQTAALRHFGGGNEVQVATFGPGYASAAAVQPLNLAINAAPSATSRGGAEENGNTVTIATGNPHTLQVGDTVTVAGVGVADYNGTFTVTAVPSSRSFQYTNPISGLATSGGGTVTLATPGATESGNTVTITTAAPHGRSAGDWVTIAGVGVAGYNGPFLISNVLGPRQFQYTAPTSGLASSGGGSATYFSPFQFRIGGNDSVVVGGNGLPYSNGNLTAAINGIPGFAGSATVTGAAATGFTITYGGASAGIDVPNVDLVNLSCGGCFASVEETNHGGALDSFKLSYNGTESAPIVNGTNYTAAGIQTALLSILPAGATATVTGFGGGTFNNNGFQVTFGGTLAATDVQKLDLTGFTAGASGFTNEIDHGGIDSRNGLVTPTGNAIPVVTAPAGYTIPLRTPFALTGSGSDTDGDTLTYSWEQNDRGAAAGTSLLSNTKTNGPLFAMFPVTGNISETDTLQYNSPHENHVTTSPTRVFPDLQQILDNNTNAETGACTTGPVAPPVPNPIRECFAEFLPTVDYVGFAGTNAAPATLHFRLTARDGHPGGGGNASADTTLTLAPTAGPFLVTSPNSAASYAGGSTQTITWDKANTDLPPVGTANVKISLSTDGGHTYPLVLAAETPNDGSEDVTIPHVSTDSARIKVEAVDNVFFDVSNANFSITDNVKPTISASPSPAANGAGWNNSDVTVALSAADDANGSGIASITYSAVGAQPIASTTVNGDSTSVVISGEGTTTLSFYATDNSGNDSDTGSVTINLDKTAPAVTTSRDPAPNANGWNNTDVGAHYSATDGGSGLVGPATADFTFTDEGAGQTHTESFTDAAGNVGSGTVDQVNIDKTAPIVETSRTPAPNANGWNNTNVTGMYDASDGLSGISGAASRTFVFSDDGAGQSHTESFSDLAGNAASGTVSGVNIDKTAPEAFLRFDPAARAIAVFGRDGLSGTSAGALSPSAVASVGLGDRGSRVQRRTFDVVDRAGNTLRLVEVDDNSRSDASVTIASLQYNGGPILSPADNDAAFDWLLEGNGTFHKLSQQFEVASPLQTAEASWKSNDNVTRITSTDAGGRRTTTVPGLFAVRLATNAGALVIETTP